MGTGGISAHGSRHRLVDILGIVFSGPALRRCIPTAIVVGSVLSAINQGAVIGNGDATAATWVRIGFNYLIPFVVANVGFCSAVLAAQRSSAPRDSDAKPSDAIERWISAINKHDLDAIAACFAEDYADEAPARPGEVVRGRDQVRANFERLLSAMPDIRAELRGAVDQGDTVWMEWAMHGSRPNGSKMEFAGINVFEVKNGVLQRGRIYTELVRSAGGLDAQVERMTKGT